LFGIARTPIGRRLDEVLHAGYEDVLNDHVINQIAIVIQNFFQVILAVFHVFYLRKIKPQNILKLLNPACKKKSLGTTVTLNLPKVWKYFPVIV